MIKLALLFALLWNVTQLNVASISASGFEQNTISGQGIEHPNEIRALGAQFAARTKDVLKPNNDGNKDQNVGVATSHEEEIGAIRSDSRCVLIFPGSGQIGEHKLIRLFPVDVSVGRYAAGGRLSAVANRVFKVPNNVGILDFWDRGTLLNRQIGPDLGLADLTGVNSDCLSGAQGGENQYDRANRKNYTYNSGLPHDAGEERHLLLSIQVLLGALMIASGFYLLMNTVPQGWKLEAEAFFGNVLLGKALMILGGLLCANALLG